VAASEDRARRRQERRESAGTGPAQDAGSPPSKPPRVAEDAAPAGGDGHHLPKGNFVRESADELKKVEWPGQAQVIQATTVVLIACIIVGLWLYANDFVWQRVVKHILL
jgi:preprotein translocase SecE subunit